MTTTIDTTAVALPTRRAVPVQLLLLAGPMIASMVSRTVMSFVDFAMVSQLGTDAQAAMMPAGIILFCAVSFGMGLVQAVNTLVAQCFGRGELHECAAYTWQGVYVSAAFGVLVLVLWPILPVVFHWIDHPPAVRDMEITYAQIGLLHIGPAIGAVAVSGFFNGIHRPTVGFIATVVANVFNALANYVLIFGNFGFPALGVAGAAWATVAASFLNFAILGAWMFLPGYRHDFGVWRMRRFSEPRLLRLGRVGLPMGVQFSTDIVGWAIFTNLLVGMFGTAHLAANNIAFKFMELSFMPAVGMGAALTSAVGKCLGESRPGQARRFVHWCLGMLMLYMGTIGLALFVFRHGFVGLLSDDPDVIAVGAGILICAAIFQVSDAMNITYMSALRGAGDTQWIALVNVLLVGAVLLGLSWVLALVRPQWGSLGPWVGATAYIIILAVTQWGRYRWGPWERLELFK